MRVVWALLLTFLPSIAWGQAGSATEAEAALRAGQYAQAIESATAATRQASDDVAARRALVRALMETGRYAEAEAAAREGGSLALANLLGEAFYAQGKVQEAEAEFRRASASGAPDRLPGELNLAILLLGRGDREEALERFDRFIDYYNQAGARALSSDDLTAIATAVQHLGVRNPQLFRDAVRAYDEAIAADPGNPEPKLRLGELFIEKYNSPDAHATFQEVLAVNRTSARALLGMARAQEFDGDIGAAFALVNRALETNPSYVPARVRLARLNLDHEDSGAAEEEIQKALRVNPASLEALSVLAAIRYVQGDQSGFRQARDSVLRLNPRYAEFYTTVAEIAARYRRYADAASLAQEAVALDEEAWSAHGVLGINLLRVGRVEDAQQSLELSFRGDPFNVWIKNTLDLLDTYPQYEVRRTPHFELVLHRDEADLLYPFISELAEEGYERLVARYGYRPEGLIRLEVYPRHADFSVRTVGLAGLGALGVSFGNVLAMDSPRARDVGTFNWGSTFWHELAHTITLGASDHRVPRWLTEGLSVLEERRAREGWGSEMAPGFLAAYYEEELPPVSRLNEGFIRPRSPQHLGLAYHLASLVVQWIEETHGFDAIQRMLRAYGQGQATPQVLRLGLRMEPDAVDREFDSWIRAKYPPTLLSDLRVEMESASRAMQTNDLPGARIHLERAVEIMPTFGSSRESPLALLAELHLRDGDKRSAADALTRLTAVNEIAYAENLQLAELLQELGDDQGAAAALERAIYIYPYDLSLHRRLAELYASSDQRDKVVRQRRAIVALRPVDEAEARYQLATALADVGDAAAARREVLRALEIAPGFERAQDLLLRLREGN